MPRTRQKARITPAAQQGDRIVQEQLASAAPSGPSAITGGSQPAIPPNDVFAPTDFPDEPPTAGVPYGPGSNGPSLLPDDPDMLLRLMYQLTGDPDLLGLIRE